MYSYAEEERIVRFQSQAVAVKIRLTGQTDDDWYTMEILPVDNDGNVALIGYPLKVSRPLKNIGEVKCSQDGLTLVAMEFDGDVIVWTRQLGKGFRDNGQILRAGRPITNLTVNESGREIAVRLHTGPIKRWTRSANNDFVAAD